MTYSIKDVAKITGCSIFTIRFYDKEGLLPFVSRDKSGYRKFTESDLTLFKLICCLKNTGMQVKDIRMYIDLYMKGPDTLDLQKNLLLKHQKVIIDQIDNLKENLVHIQKKIEIYESPDAVDRFIQQREKAQNEKQENNLLRLL